LQLVATILEVFHKEEIHHANLGLTTVQKKAWAHATTTPQLASLQNIKATVKTALHTDTYV
jgi:hypothetical protein